VNNRSLIIKEVIGQIEAGFPSAAEEELADAISLDDFMIRNKAATFLLKVSGESMIQAGICPGDLVLVERGRVAKNNDIIVAQVDDAWTIKRLINSKPKADYKNIAKTKT